MRQVSTFIVISLLLVACTPTLNPTANTPPQATSTATQAACQPSQILKTNNSFPEVRGTMKSGGELWALLFFDKAAPNTDLKFVWRITATGGTIGFQAQAQNENGTIILPIWGPDYHESSTWQRPGMEWGTGFNFPEPGCWTITVSLGTTKGEIYLDVVSP